MTSVASRSPGYKSYTGVAYLFATILISIWGNVLFQSYLFPLFPYPLFISLTSCVFPVLSVFTARRKNYGWDIWKRYLSITPFTLMNSLASGIMYNWSLLLTSMSAVTVITSSSTLFSLIFSRILLGTQIRFQTVISIHSSIVGSVLVISASTSPSALDAFLGVSRDATDEYSQHILGCILALLSSVCSGLSSVLFTKLQIQHTDAYMASSGASAIVYTCMFLVLNTIFNFESLQVQNHGSACDVFWIILLNGLISSVIGTQMYLKSLTRLSPVTVNVLWSLSIPLTVVVDYIRGTVHSVSSSFLLGALLVLLSTVLVPIEQNETSVADITLERDIPLLIIPDETPENSDCNPDLEAFMLSSSSTRENDSLVRST
jgi:drug/metabolite transporter (DMT)-like permease